MRFQIETKKTRKLPSRVAVLYLISHCCLAEISTDGSVGPAQVLNGPNFNIHEGLGSRVGSNLFHSFQRFNLANGEQAIFSGSSAITNVINRVTGGELSTINGVLSSQIGQADFFFINPSGIVFGDTAQIDVPGSFFVSTAHQLGFADGTVFSANTVQPSTLSSAAPEYFGFLEDQTASIRINGSQIEIGSGQTLALNSADLNIDKSKIRIDRGVMQLAALGNVTSNVAIDGSLSQTARGTLSVSESELDTSGDGVGLIRIDAKDLDVNSSELLSNNVGPQDANQNNGIQFNANRIVLRDSNVRARTETEGNAGNIVVQTGDLNLLDSTRWSVSTSGSGKGGDVIINADHIVLDQLSGISANALESGDAGNITITGLTQDNVENLSLNAGGTISSSTFAAGNAGTISIFSDAIDMTGGVSIEGCCFFPSSIVVNSQRMAEPSARGGTLRIKTGSLVMKENAGIGSTAGGLGPGGELFIEASHISILSSSEITTFSRGRGSGGSLNLKANTVLIDGQMLDEVTGIGAQTLDEESGATGSINLDIGTLVVKNNGSITLESSSVFGDVLAPVNEPNQITIRADRITVDKAAITSESTGNVTAGAIQLDIGSDLILHDAQITTAASSADGGDISIDARTIDLQDSQVTTSVSGQGNGGDIVVDSDLLVLDSGFIQANTAGSNASGGDIQITAQALAASHNRLLTGGNTVLDVQPGLNVIQAAAPDGVSGTIDITSPQLDISGDLIQLDSTVLNIDELANSPCAIKSSRQSSLVILGRGGLPASPEQPGTVTITPQRLKNLLQQSGNQQQSFTNIHNQESGVSATQPGLLARQDIPC